MEDTKCIVCTPDPAANSRTFNWLLFGLLWSRRGRMRGERTVLYMGTLLRSAEGDSRMEDMENVEDEALGCGLLENRERRWYLTILARGWIDEVWN